jgi:hypothetical protein
MMKPKSKYVLKITILILLLVIVLYIIFFPPPPPSPASSPRTIQFSGHTWWVKSSSNPVGPGPNFFSDSSDNVWVDGQGRLHMRTTWEKDHWECAEIVSNESFGYGEYAFTLASNPESLDEEVVLGLFTWDDQSDYYHREIDIEFSRWENQTNVDAQYVLQPWDFPNHIYRFDVISNGRTTTHSFRWEPDQIAFRSYLGAYAVTPDPGNAIQSWDYTGSDIPPPGNENARINLWLVNGRPPANGKGAEIVLEQFRYIL